MSDKVYNKNLLGMEDLVTTETSEQVRNGATVTLKGVVAANIDAKDSKSVLGYLEFLEGRILMLEQGAVRANSIVMNLKAKEAISKGDPLAIDGYNAGLDMIEIRIADPGDIIFAVAFEDMALSENRLGLNTGLLEGFDTSMYNIGDIIYYEISTSTISTTEPSTLYQSIGYVLKSNQNNGAVFYEVSAPKLPLGV